MWKRDVVEFYAREQISMNSVHDITVIYFEIQKTVTVSGDLLIAPSQKEVIYYM